MKYALRIIPRHLRIQNQFGFYKSGIKNEQTWYGLEVPFLDVRIVKFLK